MMDPRSRIQVITTSSFQDEQNRIYRVGSPIGISLTFHRHAPPTRILVSRGARLVLLHACYDTSRVLSGQARLLFRCNRRERGRADCDEGEPWRCICNFLGRDDGGSSLPASTSLGGMEAVGPCVLEFAADGTDCEGEINVFGHVLSGSEAVLEDNLLQEQQQGSRRSEKEMFASCRRQNYLQIPKNNRKVPPRQNGCNQSARKANYTRVSMGMMLLISLVSLFEIGRSNVRIDVPPTRNLSSRQFDGLNVTDFQLHRALASKHSKKVAVPTFMPTSESTLPSLSPSDYGRPSHFPSRSLEPSIPPSSHQPSIPPSYECTDLSISLQIPKLLGSKFHPFNWTIAALGNEDEDTVWSMSYDYHDNTNRLIANHPIFEDLFVVENSNSTDAINNSVCIPKGSYTLSFEAEQSPQDSELYNNAIYVISSNGRKLKCGLGFGRNITFQVQPDDYNATDGDSDELYAESGCMLPQCSFGSVNCTEQEFDARRCFYSAYEDVKYNYAFLEPIIDRDFWLDDRCGPILADACNTRTPLGFSDDSDSEDIGRFCAYHKCAYDAIQANLTAGDYYGCECMYENWYCHWDSEAETCGWGGTFQQEVLDCCTDDFGLETSCSCVIEPECKDGDNDMCKVAAKHCCDEGDHSCDEYLRIGCERSVQVDPGAIGTCRELASRTCSPEAPYEAECECDFWEPLCLSYPGKACNEALEACCDTDRGFVDGFGNSGTHCGCDLFRFLEDVVNYETMGEKETFCSAAEDELLSSSDYESSDLSSLYWATNGSNWLNRSGWEEDLLVSSTEPNYCIWYGISCDETGHVISINLRGNNLTGAFPSYAFQSFARLEMLDLSENSLSGTVEYFYFFSLRSLLQVDLSHNLLEGEADILFSPAIEYLNLSHNKFDRVANYKKFKSAYETLQVVDFGFNKIDQEASEILTGAPPNLKDVYMSNNRIRGTLPNIITNLEGIRRFHVDCNCLSGSLPDLPRSFPFLKELNLSNQQCCPILNSSNIGLSGSVPEGLSNLFDLAELDLSENSISGSIPSDIGNLPRLKTFNVSNNIMTSTVPYNLGKLWNSIAVFDVSRNKLRGTIPSVLGTFEDAAVHVRNNGGFIHPAPMTLCFDVSGFDLRHNPTVCPLERNTLRHFYISAKGQEWTESMGWDDEYADHCSYYGVVCNDESQVVELHLANNGLSGTLTEKVKNLKFLRRLDLSDNDIKGSIPSGVGELQHLDHLRLSYNAFTGEVPTDLENLQNLRLLHLHGNRLTGTMPPIPSDFLTGVSSFVSDCGVPSDFGTPIRCPECTMCCNLAGNCQSTEIPTSFQDEVLGFDIHQQFSWVFGISLATYMMFLLIGSFAYDRLSESRSYYDRSMKERDKKYALNKIGSGSVYSFFLTKNWVAWLIAVIVMGIQAWILAIFVEAAKLEFVDDNSDFIYSWRCPRNEIECDDTADQDVEGWIMFAVLMASHLLSDLLNGSKLLVLSAKRRHSLCERARFFVGGSCLIFITAFTVYASSVYNVAIARSNTDIVINSVIILFVTQVDEQLFIVFSAASPKSMKKVERHLKQDIKKPLPPKDDDDDLIFDVVEHVEDQSKRSQTKITNYFREVSEDISAEVEPKAEAVVTGRWDEEQFDGERQLSIRFDSPKTRGKTLAPESAAAVIGVREKIDRYDEHNTDDEEQMMRLH